MFLKRLNVTYGIEISSKYDDLVEVANLIFELPPLGEQGCYDFTTVIMSVCQ